MSEDRASGAFWAHYPRDFVMVEGLDALSYLHSQVSQDIQLLAVGASAWTLLLQPTGKVDVLARVLRSGDAAYVFDVDAGAGDALVARLLRFKIRVKADVSVIPWRCIAVRGVAATALGGREPHLLQAVDRPLHQGSMTVSMVDFDGFD